CAPQPAQSSDRSRAPAQAGQASRAKAAGTLRSEDRIDERRQRLDARSEDQQEAGHAQEDGERHDQALLRSAPPQAARQLPGRAEGAAEDMERTPNLP